MQKQTKILHRTPPLQKPKTLPHTPPSKWDRVDEESCCLYFYQEIRKVGCKVEL